MKTLDNVLKEGTPLMPSLPLLDANSYFLTLSSCTMLFTIKPSTNLLSPLTFQSARDLRPTRPSPTN